MATYKGGLDLDIAATFGDVVAEHISARVLPFTGPTYDDLSEQHQRWMAGETITPTAVRIGEITLKPAMHLALTRAASYGDYHLIHTTDKYDAGNVPEELEVAFGEVRVTKMMHDLVYMMSAVDAVGRGLTDFYVSNHNTFGGLPSQTDADTRRRISNAHREEVVLRYAAAFGVAEAFITDQLSKADVDNDGYIKENSPAGKLLLDPAGVLAVTLFTEQTPYFELFAADQPRISTALDISHSDISEFTIKTF